MCIMALVFLLEKVSGEHGNTKALWIPTIFSCKRTFEWPWQFSLFPPCHCALTRHDYFNHFGHNSMPHFLFHPDFKRAYF
jgi:hypothetical protein